MRGYLYILLAIAVLTVLAAPAHAQEAGDEWTEPITGMEFVWVPGGCYEMGCGEWAGDCWINEYPAHEVCVEGFWMGKYEVTEGQWETIMHDDMPSKASNNISPARSVSWDDTMEFINRLNEISLHLIEFQLPTEEEWEFACKSGNDHEMYSGSTAIDDIAWYQLNSNGNDHLVGTKSPNDFGIFDLSGNVREWTGSCYLDYIFSMIGVDANTRLNTHCARVSRGGSWSDSEWFLRCSTRTAIGPAIRENQQGFRIIIANDATP